MRMRTEMLWGLFVLIFVSSSVLSAHRARYSFRSLRDSHKRVTEEKIAKKPW